MATLLMRCPITGKAVSTGRVVASDHSLAFQHELTGINSS